MCLKLLKLRKKSMFLEKNAKVSFFFENCKNMDFPQFSLKTLNYDKIYPNVNSEAGYIKFWISKKKLITASNLLKL